MKALLVLFLTLVSVSVTRSQTFHWGSCPDPPVQKDFSLQKYLGRWYEIEKLPASFEKGICIQANYSLREDGKVKVLNEELRDGQINSIEGTAVIKDTNEPAKLGVSFFFFQPYSPYWVLSTDYDNIALVYSCSGVKSLFHFDFAWILARSRTLPAETIAAAKAHFTSNKIDISKMTATVQEGCTNNS
ncbi:APOD protein, partial [Atractosteus spatula]|nr:APOD protein [Atractosteus spatula]